MGTASWETDVVVSAVHFFATPEDNAVLLDHLGEPATISLHPWPVLAEPLVTWTREQALTARQVMIVHRQLGPPTAIRPGDPAMDGASKEGLWNRLNWERLGPSADEALVDSNVSPVIFWEPGQVSDDTIYAGSIGSQADSMSAVGADYERWVSRTTAWVRRRGTKVWGLQRDMIRPDLTIRISHVSTVYALPHALLALESGAAGR